MRCVIQIAVPHARRLRRSRARDSQGPIQAIEWRCGAELSVPGSAAPRRLSRVGAGPCVVPRRPRRSASRMMLITAQ